MKQDIAEQLFMTGLSEIQVIKEHGIIHSDEYYEVMLNDANLPKQEEVEVLQEICQKAEQECNALIARHCEKSYEIAALENDTVATDKLIKKEQKIDFASGVYYLSIIIFLFVALIILYVSSLVNLTTNATVICYIIGYVCTLVLARVLMNKENTYAKSKAFFLEELDRKRYLLDEIQTDILSLKRLIAFIHNRLDQ